MRCMRCGLKSNNIAVNLNLNVGYGGQGVRQTDGCASSCSFDVGNSAYEVFIRN